MGLIQYYHITCKPFNRAIRIIGAVPIVYLVTLFQEKCIIVYNDGNITKVSITKVLYIPAALFLPSQEITEFLLYRTVVTSRR